MITVKESYNHMQVKYQIGFNFDHIHIEIKTCADDDQVLFIKRIYKNVKILSNYFPSF